MEILFVEALANQKGKTKRLEWIAGLMVAKNHCSTFTKKENLYKQQP